MSLFLPAVLLLAGAPRTVAVSYFDNNTGKAELDALAKGLADMLITDLSNIESLQIVEREKLNEVLAELKLGKSKFIDPKTAQKLGKGLAAEFIMSGGYVLVGEDFRIDARIFEVSTGKVIASERVAGKKDEFFALEKELVDILIGALDLKLGRAEKTKLRSNPTEKFEAWKSYSDGLDARDRGDEDRARRAFQAALDADPNYRAARTAMERLAAIFQREDRKKAERYDTLRETLDPNAKDFPQKLDALLVQLDSTDTKQLAKKVDLLIWLAERDLTPSSPGLSRLPVEALAIALRYVEDPSQWETVPRVCEYFIGRYPNEDYPKTYCKNAIMKTLSYLMKQDRAAAQKRWDEARAWDRKHLEPDDWRIALLENDAAMRRLLALYAKKVEK